jgi:formylglycine-generating enzyme required for sulfatase activity
MLAVHDPLLGSLRSNQLLNEGQLRELITQVPSCQTDVTALARAILSRGWLTPYQVGQLVQGKVEELVLGEYVVLEVLGQGAMARVFKACQRRLNRLCALKVILPGRLPDPGQLARFHREAAAAARLDHPNVVRVYDAGECRGLPYLALECIDGTDLKGALDRASPLPVAAVCSWIQQAAVGLQHAQDHGLVHRDLKPSNLMLTRSGIVKVLDLGLVQMAPVHTGSASPDTLTAPGTFVGTADYLAPEQALNSKGVDIRADLYSLGCTLYHLLTGKVPFPADSLAGKLLAHQQKVAVGVEVLRPDLPRGLAAVVRRLLAKDPAERYQTPQTLAQALQPFVREVALPPRLFPAPGNESSRELGDLVPRTSCSFDQQELFPTIPQGSPSTQSQTTPNGKSRRSGPRLGIVAGTAAIVCGLVLTAALLLLSKLGGQTKPTPPGETASPAVDQKSSPASADPKPLPAVPPSRFTNAVGMTLLRIPKGTFLMGSPLAERERKQNETQHEVRLTRPFYLGAHPVTQEQYQAVMGANPSHFSRTGAGKLYVQTTADAELKRFPVENVSWEDAVGFCRKLSELPEEKGLGRVYRLPTEAEWEYACRAGTLVPLPFSFGESLSSADANFFGDNPYGGAPKGPYLSRTTAVGSYRPNAWGLCDMHGNVWQWCSDWLDDGYASRSPNEDPPGPEQGKLRCVRGGSWGSPGWDCRSACRGGFEPNRGYSHVGFRVVCTDNTTAP